MLYVFEECIALQEYIPALTYHPVNPEDAQESGEATHACDTVRYVCTAMPPVVKAEVETKTDLLRKAESNIMTFAGARKAIQRDKKRGRY